MIGGEGDLHIARPEDDVGLTTVHARRGRDIAVLALAGCVVVLALALEVRSGGRVAFRFVPDRPLPELCLSRAVGGSCPGCGLTRGIVRLAEGDWHAALAHHRLSPLMALAILAQFPYRWASLRLDRAPLGRVVPGVFGAFLFVALVVNWFCGLIQ